MKWQVTVLVRLEDGLLAQFSGLDQVEALFIDRTSLSGKALLAFEKSPLRILKAMGNWSVTDEELNTFLSQKAECQWTDQRATH